MKVVAMIATSVLLAGCGGGDGGSGASKNELAANACDAFAKAQLEEKTYTLDHAALAASMADAGDGSSLLRGPIVIEPGRSTESKQTLECTVRFVPGKELPDVLKMQFIW
jgi:outer membrane murein-binding lipoprotein Lpp